MDRQLCLYCPTGIEFNPETFSAQVIDEILLEDRIWNRHAGMIGRGSHLSEPDFDRLSDDIDYWTEVRMLSAQSSTSHFSEAINHIRRVRGYNA